ncbi:MAG: MFS transporter [Candidatus Hodarchaeota archaeon]
MLILSNRQLQRYFLGLLAMHMSLGCFRFLFPFQMLNLGGNEALISFSSSVFTIGQILGFLFFGMILTSNRSRLIIGGLFLVILMLIMGISNDSHILALSRTFEGLGYGLLFISIVSIATQFPNREGEVIGGLFAAVFSGLAVGQGFAGLLWNSLLEIGKFSSSQGIQIISYITLIITFLSLIILDISLKSSVNLIPQGWKFQHLHISTWINALIAIPSIGILMIIYSLYDFAHGLYTPNLSILLTRQGIDTISLSLGYLIGDITWGVSQIFAGKIIDKRGYPLPLILSLLLKASVVIFYPEISLIISLFVILFLAGLAEGFLEPARNKAVLSNESVQQFTHSHKHLDLGFSPSGSFILGLHKHEHKHENQPETIVGGLQSIGIFFFGIGSFIGSWLLSQNVTLDIITTIGGLCLALASLFSLVLSYTHQKTKK